MSNDQLNEVADLKKHFQQASDIFVLHVDDEEDARVYFAASLEDLSIKVLSAGSANEALDKLQRQGNDICLIVSDLRMPEVGGLEFREQVAKTHPNIPFCILSGYVDRALAMRGLELKIARIMTKPIDEAELVDLLHKEALPRLQNIIENRELKQSFVLDSEALIENSEEILLRLENDPSDAEALNQFFGYMHTLKGASAFFEPKDLHRFAHSYEDILKKLQRDELKLNENVMQVLFKGFDLIKTLFLEFKSGHHKWRDPQTLIDALQIAPEEKCDTAADAHDAPASVVSPTTKAIDPSKAKGSEDIKVSVKLLDEFMQLSGEVTVVRNMLNKCVSSIERRFAGDRDIGMLTELLSELHKINSSVQNKMAEIRKVPLKSIMRVLPRAVRDVASSLEKKVKLEISGDELRVDTSIAEILNNSLLHLIKNSVDHGIERPDERVRRGKQDFGLISVSASTRDEKVVVVISDDGKGLDPKAIRDKLVRNGTHTKAQVDSMSDVETWQMIFSPGFSTATNVTEISGRGVGMSMVKDCVDAIGGQIIIESEVGRGTSFRLELPIPKSVLIASCLGVRIDSRRLSLVQDDIVRVLQINASQAKGLVREMQGSKFLLFEGKLLPIADLVSLLGLVSSQRQAEQAGPEEQKFIIMKSNQDGRRMVLEVTEVLDLEDMVIKNLNPMLNTKSLYRGVTFLDDGGVGLILNTSGIMDAIGITRETGSAKEKLVDHQTQTDRYHGQVEPKRKVASALSVLTRTAGIFAIPEDFVFRIEEVPREAIKRSGSLHVMSYRDRILCVDKLSSLLSLEEATKETTAPHRKLVILKNADRLYALEVDEILEMINYDEVHRELSQKSHFISGHIFVGSQTIALLDVQTILDRRLNSSDANGNVILQTEVA